MLESSSGTRAALWLLVAALTVASGCGDDDGSPGVTLTLRASPNPTLHQIDISSEVINGLGNRIFYPAGGSDCSYRLFIPPISIEVFAPGGELVYLTYPCGFPLGLPPFVLPLESERKVLM